MTPRLVAFQCGGFPIIVGQQNYTVDISALGLASAPRGCQLTLSLPTGASNYGGFMDKTLTTPTVLHIHLDAIPDPDVDGDVAYTLIP